MTKQQITILTALGLAVLCVLCFGGYIAISEESAYRQAATPRVSVPRPTAAWTPTRTPTPKLAADCRDVDEVGWLMDYDCRGEIFLYAEPKPPSQTQVVTVIDMTDPVYDGTCDSLIVDINKECLVDGILYYHVDVGELGSGWADVDYVYPGPKKPQR